jgi:hypothetical protein
MSYRTKVEQDIIIIIISITTWPTLTLYYKYSIGLKINVAYIDSDYES